MPVHMYVYVYVYAHMCTHVHTHGYTYVHMYVHIYVHMYVYTHVYTHVYTQAQKKITPEALAVTILNRTNEASGPYQVVPCLCVSTVCVRCADGVDRQV